MKNIEFLKPLGFADIRDYDLSVGENGLTVFGRGGTSSAEKRFTHKGGISNLILLVSFFLFTNFLFAQQPGCNVKATRDGGGNFNLTSEVSNSGDNTIYLWEFISNTAGATFVSENGKSSITVKPGKSTGGAGVRLTVTNPASSNESSKSSSCSITVTMGGH